MTRTAVLSHARLLAVAVAALLMAGVAWQVANPPNRALNARAADGIQIFMKVTGHRQGVFKGDSPTSKRQDGLITVTGYAFEVVSPRDPATGQASGKRQYKPVVVTHVLGGSSPQFLAALATNEVLTSVVIDFVRTNKNGQEVTFYRVTLTDAVVTSIKHFTSGADVLDEDSLIFRKIEQTDLIAHTTFIDDFQSRA